MDNQPPSPPPINSKHLYLFWVAALIVLSWLAQQLFNKENNINLNVKTVITSNGGTQVVLSRPLKTH